MNLIPWLFTALFLGGIALSRLLLRRRDHAN